MKTLLSREEFNKQCLTRDKNECVLCGSKEELCVHHIMERKLFTDGGYYLTNGVTVCSKCHLRVESNQVLPNELYLKINAPEEVPEIEVDKWGQIVEYKRDDSEIIVKVNDYSDKLAKAVLLAGLIFRRVNAGWVRDYYELDLAYPDDTQMLVINRLVPLYQKESK